MTLRRPSGKDLLVACASPLIGFPALWLLAVALAQIHVLRIQTPWSATAWITILLVPVMFLIGGIGAKMLIDRRVPEKPAGTGVRTHRRLLIGLVIAGYAELAREFATAGAVPLLSRHIDQARVSIHPGALGLLVDALTVAAVVAIATPPRLFERSAAPELAIAVIALGGFALSGGREAIAVAAAGLIARLLYWGTPHLRSVLLVGLAGLALFGLVFWVRTGQELNQAFTHELYGNVVSDTFKPFIPLLPGFFALAMNPVVLTKVIAYFPHSMPYGHGIYDAGAIHSLVHASDLGAITSKLSAPWVVSTAAGPLWADGGLAVVLVGFVVIGAVTTSPYALYRRTHRFTHVVLAGYFVSLALFCVYQDLMTTYKDWVFVAAGLFLVGRTVETPAAAERPAERSLSIRSPLVLGAVVVTAALLVLEVVIADRNVTRLRNIEGIPAGAPQPRTIAPNVYEIPLTVPPEAAPLLRDRLASGPSGAPELWAFARGGRSLAVTPITVSGVRLSVGQTIALPRRFPADAAAYSVARWGPRHLPAAFALQPVGDAISVTVASLGSHSRVLLRTTTPRIPDPAGSRRDLSVAVAGSRGPDLFLTDRDPVGHLTIYGLSGSSLFQRVVLARTPRLPSVLPPRRWHVAVGAVQSQTADLLFLGSASSGRGVQLEAHVLLGSSGYRAFGAQTKLGIMAANAPKLRFVIASTPPAARVYMINVAGQTVDELQFS